MLINCLETGKDIWSDLEKRLLQKKGSWNGRTINTSRHRQWSCWLSCPKAVNRQYIQAIYWAWWDCNNGKMLTGAYMSHKFIIRNQFFSFDLLVRNFLYHFLFKKGTLFRVFFSNFLWMVFFKTKEEKSIKRPFRLLRSPFLFSQCLGD